MNVQVDNVVKIKLIKSNITSFAWLVDSKNKRLTPKFKILSIKYEGMFWLIKTNKGSFLYNSNCEVVFEPIYDEIIQTPNRLSLRISQSARRQQ